MDLTEIKVPIQVNNLTKIYPNNVIANNNITIHLDKNEIVGIIGPNGAGKTTLLRQILGLLKPTEGSIRIYGYQIDENPKIIQEKIGYVPQTPLYFPALSAEDVVGYILKLRGYRGKDLLEKRSMIMEKFSLKEFVHLPSYQLSSGLRKILLLAIAWAKESEIFVLDEPTSMVDILRKKDVWDIIKKSQNEGYSMLLSSHDMNEIKEICDRIYILSGGQIIFEGNIDQMTQILKMPAEVELIPTSMESAISFLKNKVVTWEQKGIQLRVAFPSLEEGIDFLVQLTKNGGARYLSLEAPSFEKLIIRIITSGSEEKLKSSNEKKNN